MVNILIFLMTFSLVSIGLIGLITRRSKNKQHKSGVVIYILIRFFVFVLIISCVLLIGLLIFQ